jgi:DNA-binding NtrC family response regulator
MALVLVVDREEGSARALASALEKIGYRVDQVSDGSTAYAYLRRSIPQAIVLDLMEEMPEEPHALPEGIKLLAQFHLDHPSIPLLIWTDHSGYRRHFWSRVATGHLEKSEGCDPVVKAVRRLVPQVAR